MGRAPEAFSIDDPATPAKTGRQAVNVVETPDAFAEAAALPPEPVTETRGRFWLRLFWSAIGAFLLLALGTWAWDFVAGLVARVPSLGYVAIGLAGVALLALLVIVGREIAALARLGSAERMRQAATTAFSANDDGLARRFVDQIIAFYAGDPGTAHGRAALDGHAKEIIDAPHLVTLAERELLAAKDAAARAAIASASSRVAMVTTVSPRAWVDIMFVLTQSFMLIRRIATIYAGRPGGLAIWRLSARVASHLAITGGIAVAGDAVSQVLGAGIVSRLSSKLGEGVLNGVLTARVGLSAIAVCRPMPFLALPAPALADVAGSLLAGRAPAEKTGG